jgi:hypothetical protein
MGRAEVHTILNAKDYYEVLGVSMSCTNEDLRRAFKHLSLAVHPDKSSVPGSSDAFQLVKQAYNILSEKSARAEYNSSSAVRRRIADLLVQEGAHRWFGFIPLLLILLVWVARINQTIPPFSLSQSVAFPIPRFTKSTQKLLYFVKPSFLAQILTYETVQGVDRMVHQEWLEFMEVLCAFETELNSTSHMNCERLEKIRSDQELHID